MVHRFPEENAPILLRAHYDQKEKLFLGADGSPRNVLGNIYSLLLQQVVCYNRSRTR